MDGPVGIFNTTPSTWTLETAYAYATARAVPSPDPDGEPLYNCPFRPCSKQFSKRFNLKAHLRVHTGDKPFSCSFPGCTRRFMWKSSLTSHQTGHTRRKAELAKRSASAMSDPTPPPDQHRRWSSSHQSSILPPSSSSTASGLPTHPYPSSYNNNNTNALAYQSVSQSRRLGMSHQSPNQQLPPPDGIALTSAPNMHHVSSSSQPFLHPSSSFHPHPQLNSTDRNINTRSNNPPGMPLTSDNMGNNNTIRIPPSSHANSRTDPVSSRQERDTLSRISSAHPPPPPYSMPQSFQASIGVSSSIGLSNNTDAPFGGMQLPPSNRNGTLSNPPFAPPSSLPSRSSLDVGTSNNPSSNNHPHQHLQEPQKRLSISQQPSDSLKRQRHSNDLNNTEFSANDSSKPPSTIPQNSQPLPSSTTSPSLIASLFSQPMPSSTLSPLVSNTPMTDGLSSSLTKPNSGSNGASHDAAGEEAARDKLREIKSEPSTSKNTSAPQTTKVKEESTVGGSSSNNNNEGSVSDALAAAKSEVKREVTLPSPLKPSSIIGSSHATTGTLSTPSLLPSPSVSLGLPRSPSAFSQQFLFPGHASSPTWVTTPTVPYPGPPSAGLGSMSVSPKPVTTPTSLCNNIGSGSRPPSGGSGGSSSTAMDVQMSLDSNGVSGGGELSPLPADLAISPSVNSSPVPPPILPQVQNVASRPRRIINRGMKPPIAAPSVLSSAAANGGPLPPIGNVAPKNPPTHIELELGDDEPSSSLPALGSPHTDLSPLPVASPIIFGTVQTPTSPFSSIHSATIKTKTTSITPTSTW